MNQLIGRERVYRPSEVAQALRISSATVSRAIRAGKLKAFRVGGQWRILGSDLARYLDLETGTANNPASDEPRSPQAAPSSVP